MKVVRQVVLAMAGLVASVTAAADAAGCALYNQRLGRLLVFDSKGETEIGGFERGRVARGHLVVRGELLHQGSARARCVSAPLLVEDDAGGRIRVTTLPAWFAIETGRASAPIGNDPCPERTLCVRVKAPPGSSVSFGAESAVVGSGGILQMTLRPADAHASPRPPDESDLLVTPPDRSTSARFPLGVLVRSATGTDRTPGRPGDPPSP